MLNKPCIYGYGIYFLLHIVGFDLLILCWEFLCLCSSEIEVCSFPFFVISLVLVSRQYCSHRISFRKYSFCFYFLKKTWYNFILKCQKEFTSETTWVWCFLFWKVNYWFNFFNKRTTQKISPCVNSGILYISRNWSILPK